MFNTKDDDTKFLNYNSEEWEEKKSDILIATHIVSDAYHNNFDCAVLISNDADLTPSLFHIKHNLKKLVVVINP